MAGLADMFGDNPFSSFVQQNRGRLGALGAGLASGQNFSAGLSNAAQNLPQGAAADTAWAAQQQEQAKQQETINRTTEWLRQNGQSQLLAAVESGALQPADAWKMALEQQQAASAGVKPIEINGQLVNPATGQVMGDYRDPAAPPAAPSGYQWVTGANGPQQTYVPGGPADPSTQAKTTEAQRRNQQLASVITPELQAVEQNWDALADGGNQTWGSNPVTAGLTSPEYQQARNSLGVIAQSYLYSVSGAAATDAEVQKIVDSVTPKPFESPQSIAAKKARIQQMADAVIQAGGGGAPQPVAPAGNTTSSGLQWSIEP